MPTLTHTTLVDSCNFPSIRFGSYYTGRLPNVTISGDTVTVPGPESVSTTQNGVAAVLTGYSEEVTSTGETITNHLIDGLPSITDDGDIERNTISGPRVIKNSYFENNPTFATTVEEGVSNNGGTATRVTSSFGSVASDINVTRTSTGATVIGKSCGPS